MKEVFLLFYHNTKVVKVQNLAVYMVMYCGLARKIKILP